jgi:hypothetical protein
MEISILFIVEKEEDAQAEAEEEEDEGKVQIDGRSIF